MMVGTVTVVIHDTLFTVTTTVVLGASVDGVAGTDVVVSVQKGIMFTADTTQQIGDSDVNSQIQRLHVSAGTMGAGAEVFRCRKS